MQNHEEMEQHSGPHICVDLTHLRARGAYFWVLCHAPAWEAKVSPNLIHFKAHQRGFHWGYKLDLGRHEIGRKKHLGTGLEGRETER